MISTVRSARSHRFLACSDVRATDDALLACRPRKAAPRKNGNAGDAGDPGGPAAPPPHGCRAVAPASARLSIVSSASLSVLHSRARANGLTQARATIRGSLDTRTRILRHV